MGCGRSRLESRKERGNESRLNPVKVKGNPFGIQLNAVFFFWGFGIILRSEHSHTTSNALVVIKGIYCVSETMNYLFEYQSN